jgi:hypothetical protein
LVTGRQGTLARIFSISEAVKRASASELTGLRTHIEATESVFIVPAGENLIAFPKLESAIPSLSLSF